MDTRYWGPSGWRLLHLLFTNPNLDKQAAHRFLAELPYVLPCKYCRANLSEHYADLPYESAEDLERWIWSIHNKVNQKLREIGQKKPPNPPFAKVHQIYTERLQYGCTQTEFPGWEFLFSTIKDHPITGGRGTPLAGAPPLETLQTDLEKNRWNCLEPQRRFEHWVAFWNALPAVFPFDDWTTVWKECMTDDPREWNTQQRAIQSLWKLRCQFEEKLALLNKTTFKHLCNDLTFHRSGCASRSNRSKTCRRLRQTRKTQR